MHRTFSAHAVPLMFVLALLLPGPWSGVAAAPEDPGATASKATPPWLTYEYCNGFKGYTLRVEVFEDGSYVRSRLPGGSNSSGEPTSTSCRLLPEQLLEVRSLVDTLSTQKLEARYEPPGVILDAVTVIISVSSARFSCHTSFPSTPEVVLPASLRRLSEFLDGLTRESGPRPPAPPRPPAEAQ